MASNSNRKSARAAYPRSALLLAAGLGARLRSTADVPKPLVQVAGRTLAEWSIMALRTGAGINHFVVSVGYASDVIKAQFAKIGRQQGVAVEFVSADDWQLGNGASALAAEPILASTPFLLSMTDHLFDPRLAGTLADYPLVSDEMCLAIDRDKDGVFDLDDVTRVRSDADHIIAIEKNLDDWDCADTGVMYCTGAIFEGLRRAATVGRHGLSDGLRELAAERRARVADVTGHFWLDVDTPEAHREAEQHHLARTAVGYGDEMSNSDASTPQPRAVAVSRSVKGPQ